MENYKKEKLKPKNIPTWWDCTWRRIPCGREDCPLCGQIKAKKKKKGHSSESQNEIEEKLEDMNERLYEILDMVENEMDKEGIDMKEIEAGGAEEGVNPEFPFIHQRVGSWCQDVYGIAEESEEINEHWLHTEAGKDLIWYTNILITKTYHQLCNRWSMKNNQDDSGEDYNYNKYVLAECLDILIHSLKKLAHKNSSDQAKFRLALLFLYNFKEEVINI